MASGTLPVRFTRLCHRLNDPRDVAAAGVVATLLLLGEAVLSVSSFGRFHVRSTSLPSHGEARARVLDGIAGGPVLILGHVVGADTEIDWEAYMQEVGGFLQGELDYKKLEGATGPLVYPAGFVYIYAGLQVLTGGGSILVAQVIFIVLYLAVTAVVLLLYIRTESVPPWALALLALSKRMHSIFMLRLFNDGFAMLFAYAATLLLADGFWCAAVLLFSLATSVKMNVLCSRHRSWWFSFRAALCCSWPRASAAGVVLQLLLGLPFLLAKPSSYVGRAFEFSRVFQYCWTVNWKMLPERCFLDRRFHQGLPKTLVRFLGTARSQGPIGRHSESAIPGVRVASPAWRGHVVWVVFMGGLVGMVFARSLHYQFYSWYFHTVPFLLWHTQLPLWLRLALWLGIELPWNVFPATPWSSSLLLLCHLTVLAALFASPLRAPTKAKKQA